MTENDLLFRVFKYSAAEGVHFVLKVTAAYLLEVPLSVQYFSFISLTLVLDSPNLPAQQHPYKLRCFTTQICNFFDVFYFGVCVHYRHILTEVFKILCV